MNSALHMVNFGDAAFQAGVPIYLNEKVIALVRREVSMVATVSRRKAGVLGDILNAASYSKAPLGIQAIQHLY